MLLIAYGTRPEYLKLKPLLKELDRISFKYRLLQIKQHVDIAQNDLPSHSTIEIKEKKLSNRLDAIVKSIMDNPGLFKKSDSAVLVQGDTTTAFAVALAAFHRQLPVLHLEAGLRTYDNRNPYPEEFNRRAISAMATFHFCPSMETTVNLNKESISLRNVFITGNTALDNLFDVFSKTEEKKHIVVTLHRTENLANMREWFKKIKSLATLKPEFSFVFPMHPNPRIKAHKEIFEGCDNVLLVDPIDHETMIELIRTCVLVITDSGGISEECAYLRKFCIVCRQVTERGLTEYEILCGDPSALISTFSKVMYEKVKGHRDPRPMVCPYGDGTASPKIAQVLLQLEQREYNAY